LADYGIPVTRDILANDIEVLIKTAKEIKNKNPAALVV
jgi:hypothetical protein